MRSGRKLVWLIAAVVMAGAGCGRGGAVQTGSGAPADDAAAELVQRSLTRALEADTYRIRVGTTVGESTGTAATSAPPCGMGAPGAARQIAVTDEGHRTALLDRGSGAVRVLRDDREAAVYLAGATLPGSGAPTEWVRLGTGELVTSIGLAALAPSLWSDLLFIATPAPDRGLLTTLQRSADVVTTVDRGEIDGVAVSHHHVTVDRQRFAAAERDLLRSAPTAASMFGVPPGTIETRTSPTSPTSPSPTFDTWVDDDGTLRRIAADLSAGNDSHPYPVHVEITYAGFDEPFPATMPAPDAATDLGSLPASVLLPLPDCFDINRPLPPPGGDLPPGMIDAFVEYSTCVTEVREQAAVGRTVAQWIEHTNGLALNSTCPLPALFPR